MLKKKSILDVSLKNKKILLRVDFNVTIEDGEILDDTRIRETIPTIKQLLNNHNSLIIISHLGRPKGEEEKYSLKPVAQRLENYLKIKVKLINHLQENAKKKTADLKSGKVVMLENVRFHSGEESNDLKYAQKLAGLAEVFVNDAFACCHRAHASTVGITKFLPSYAGLLLIKEINIISKVLHNPDRPVVCVIGGAKISDKIGLIKKQLDHSQTVLLGGGIANTFLAARGIDVGNSLIEKDALNNARELLFEAACRHTALILPIDHVTKDSAIIDIGKKTIALYRQYLLFAGTIIFNGPMGKYEEKPFDMGTRQLIKAASQSKALSVIGGGDTIACIPDKKTAGGITHISTGGGAMLEFIEKGTLPAIDVLQGDAL